MYNLFIKNTTIEAPNNCAGTTSDIREQANLFETGCTNVVATAPLHRCTLPFNYGRGPNTHLLA
jgi:hypothetical protein